MVPYYLKEIYLTLNSWRRGRDDEGWGDLKRKREDQKANINPDGLAPKLVNTVPRLRANLEALMVIGTDLSRRSTSNFDRAIRRQLMVLVMPQAVDSDRQARKQKRRRSTPCMGHGRKK